jgi:SRSO17 transposase
VLVADCGYGDVGEFRAGLEDRQVPYVAQVKADTSAYPEWVRPERLPSKGRGQPSKPRYRQPRTQLQQLALQAGQSACVDLVWRRGSKGLQRSRFLALRVRPAGVSPRRRAVASGDRALPVRWLLAEWPAGQPEPVKYWLASLPADTPTVTLVRLGKLRWRIEQDYRELKGGLGLDHFEGRSFTGWHHHVTMVSVAHGFLTLERLRRPRPAASAGACGNCSTSCRPCLPAGPAPTPPATAQRHTGYGHPDAHQPDRALLGRWPGNERAGSEVLSEDISRHHRTYVLVCA